MWLAQAQEGSRISSGTPKCLSAIVRGPLRNSKKLPSNSHRRGLQYQKRTKRNATRGTSKRKAPNRDGNTPFSRPLSKEKTSSETLRNEVGTLKKGLSGATIRSKRFCAKLRQGCSQSEFQLTNFFSRSEDCDDVFGNNFDAYFSWGKLTENLPPKSTPFIHSQRFNISSP